MWIPGACGFDWDKPSMYRCDVIRRESNRQQKSVIRD